MNQLIVFGLITSLFYYLFFSIILFNFYETAVFIENKYSSIDLIISEIVNPYYIEMLSIIIQYLTIVSLSIEDIEILSFFLQKLKLDDIVYQIYYITYLTWLFENNDILSLHDKYLI
jgi:hypothetical protein